MATRRVTLVVLALGLLLPWRFSAAQTSLARDFWLPKVVEGGKEYYRAFRVTSADGLKRIADASNLFRFFQGDGQYGEAFYLFRSLGDAQKFASCEAARGAKNRTVIAEVLLPKAHFDSVKKAQVPVSADWGLARPSADAAKQLRDLRNGNHLLFGRWATSPAAEEPFYGKMLGAKQFAFVQRGMPSVLTNAIIRRVPAKHQRLR